MAPSKFGDEYLVTAYCDGEGQEDECFESLLLARQQAEAFMLTGIYDSVLIWDNYAMRRMGPLEEYS